MCQTFSSEELNHLLSLGSQPSMCSPSGNCGSIHFVLQVLRWHHLHREIRQLYICTWMVKFKGKSRSIPDIFLKPVTWRSPAPDCVQPAAHRPVAASSHKSQLWLWINAESVSNLSWGETKPDLIVQMTAASCPISFQSPRAFLRLESHPCIKGKLAWQLPVVPDPLLSDCVIILWRTLIMFKLVASLCKAMWSILNGMCTMSHLTTYILHCYL